MEFLTGIASSIVGEITKYTIAPIGRQLGYLFHFQNNKEKIRRKASKLKIEEGQKRGEKARKEVDKWLKVVETRSKEANEMLKDEGHPKAECSCSGSFPNLVLRHQLSKKLKKMAETIASEIRKADSFQSNIILRQALIKSYFENKDFEVFDTRKPALREITRALKDPDCSKIGVYGIGGVGQTTLVQEVARQAHDGEIFSPVVMVTVSQCFDLKNVQREIAEQLGLRLEDESEIVRAGRLKERLESERECFKDLATAIVGEYCGGLPIAIVTIASALKGREIFVWQDALNEQKKSPKKGYKVVMKKSYDFLESKQEKEIMLLCKEISRNIKKYDLFRKKYEERKKELCKALRYLVQKKRSYHYLCFVV